MRIMGLDYGTKRIGVAISDGLLITAQPYPSIYCKDSASDISAIVKLAKDNDVGEIVVGLPLNMNGTESASSRDVVEFVKALSSAISMPVVTWDERLTSMQAERTMLEADMSRGKRRQLSDKLAAGIMLQSYMDYKKRSERR